MDFLSGILSVKGLAAALGVSVLGLLGIMALLRATISEVLDAVVKTKIFVAKYQTMLSGPEAKKDYEALKYEWDEALEQAAILLDRIKQKGLADKLRKAI